MIVSGHTIQVTSLSPANYVLSVGNNLYYQSFPSSGSAQVSTNTVNVPDGDYVIGFALTAPSASQVGLIATVSVNDEIWLITEKNSEWVASTSMVNGWDTNTDKSFISNTGSWSICSDICYQNLYYESLASYKGSRAKTIWYTPCTASTTLYVRAVISIPRKKNLVELLVAGAFVEGKLANFAFKSSYGSNQYLRKYVDDGDYLLALNTYCDYYCSVNFYATLRLNGKTIAISDNNNGWRMLKFQNVNFAQTSVAGYDTMNFDDSSWLNVPSTCDGTSFPYNDDQILDPLNPAQPYALSSCSFAHTRMFARLKFNTNGTVYNAGEPYTFNKRLNSTMHRVFIRSLYPNGIQQLTLSNGVNTYNTPYTGVLNVDMVNDNFYWDVPDGKYVLGIQIDVNKNPFAMTLMINGDVFAVTEPNGRWKWTPNTPGTSSWYTDPTFDDKSWNTVVNDCNTAQTDASIDQTRPARYLPTPGCGASPNPNAVYARIVFTLPLPKFKVTFKFVVDGSWTLRMNGEVFSSSSNSYSSKINDVQSITTYTNDSVLVIAISVNSVLPKSAGLVGVVYLNNVAVLGTGYSEWIVNRNTGLNSQQYLSTSYNTSGWKIPTVDCSNATNRLGKKGMVSDGQVSSFWISDVCNSSGFIARAQIDLASASTMAPPSSLMLPYKRPIIPSSSSSGLFKLADPAPPPVVKVANRRFLVEVRITCAGTCDVTIGGQFFKGPSTPNTPRTYSVNLGDGTWVIAVAATAYGNNYGFAATVAIDRSVLFVTGVNSQWATSDSVSPQWDSIANYRLLSGGNWDINKLQCGDQSIASGASLYGSKPSTIWFDKTGYWVDVDPDCTNSNNIWSRATITLPLKKNTIQIVGLAENYMVGSLTNVYEQKIPISSFKNYYNMDYNSYIDDGDYLLALRVQAGWWNPQSYAAFKIKVNNVTVVTTSQDYGWLMANSHPDRSPEIFDMYSQPEYRWWWNAPVNCSSVTIPSFVTSPPLYMPYGFNGWSRSFFRIKFNTNGTIYNPNVYTYELPSPIPGWTKMYLRQTRCNALSVVGSNGYVYIPPSYYWGLRDFSFDLPPGDYVMAVDLTGTDSYGSVLMAGGKLMGITGATGRWRIFNPAISGNTGPTWAQYNFDDSDWQLAVTLCDSHIFSFVDYIPRAMSSGSCDNNPLTGVYLRYKFSVPRKRFTTVFQFTANENWVLYNNDGQEIINGSMANVANLQTIQTDLDVGWHVIGVKISAPSTQVPGLLGFIYSQDNFNSSRIRSSTLIAATAQLGTWKYSLSKPENDWLSTNFDDSSWSNAAATDSACGAPNSISISGMSSSNFTHPSDVYVIPAAFVSPSECNAPEAWFRLRIYLDAPAIKISTSSTAGGSSRKSSAPAINRPTIGLPYAKSSSTVTSSHTIEGVKNPDNTLISWLPGNLSSIWNLIGLGGLLILLLVLIVIGIHKYRKTRKRKEMMDAEKSKSVNESSEATELQPQTQTTSMGTSSTYTSSMSSGTTYVGTEMGLSIPGYLELNYGVDYRPKKVIARGGFGTVSMADALNSRLQAYGKEVVVKEMDQRAINDKNTALFLQEVSIMELLKSNINIATILGYSQSPPTIVMKFYHYGSLYHYVMSTKIKTSKRIVVYYALDIARGLKFMHSKGLVHADIKSMNVLIDYNEELQRPVCVITDFGITQVIGNNNLLVHAYVPVRIKGFSPVYAAPEAIARYRDITSSMTPENIEMMYFYDVYSYAIVFFELLCRKRSIDSYK